MLLVVAAMQFAFYGLAAHAASLALSAGSARARAYGGDIRAGERLARHELAQIAPNLVLDPKTYVETSPGHPSILVLTGSVPSVFPGVHLRIRVASAGLQQAFTAG